MAQPKAPRMIARSTTHQLKRDPGQVGQHHGEFRVQIIVDGFVGGRSRAIRANTYATRPQTSARSDCHMRSLMTRQAPQVNISSKTDYRSAVGISLKCIGNAGRRSHDVDTIEPFGKHRDVAFKIHALAP